VIATASERRNDVGRLSTRVASTLTLRDLGVIALTVTAPYFLVESFSTSRSAAMTPLLKTTVDADAIARGGFDIHSGHADRGVAHNVDAEFFGAASLAPW